MCEANAYVYKNGKAELILETVDLVEPREQGGFLLRNIYGDQKNRQRKNQDDEFGES